MKKNYLNSERKFKQFFVLADFVRAACSQTLQILKIFTSTGKSYILHLSRSVALEITDIKCKLVIGKIYRNITYKKNKQIQCNSICLAHQTRISLAEGQGLSLIVSGYHSPFSLRPTLVAFLMPTLSRCLF